MNRLGAVRIQWMQRSFIILSEQHVILEMIGIGGAVTFSTAYVYLRNLRIGGMLFKYERKEVL